MKSCNRRNRSVYLVVSVVVVVAAALSSAPAGSGMPAGKADSDMVGSLDFVYLVAGIASTGGSGNTSWKSYLSATNFNSYAVELELIYRHQGGTVTRNHSLDGYSTVGWDDVTSSLFGVAGSSSGAVEVRADGNLIVQARTYNDAPGGTYGQYLPGVALDDMVDDSEFGILGQLRNSDGFRTNIGFINPGPSECEVKVIIRDTTGFQLGYNVWETVPAGGWKQINNAFSEAYAGSADLAFAVVEVETAGCSIWAYASVIDGNSGDPTTIPVVTADWFG